MSIQVWTWILVGITCTIYIGIAIWTRAGSTKEFYVAGGGVSPLANGLATAADWMSAASFISMAGLISFDGYDGSVYLMGWTGGYVLLALLLASYLRKFEKFTVPVFIGDRYYSNNLIETVSNKEYEKMPEWFENWEKTGLISFDDKNKDGKIQYVADANKNELIVDKDIMVLANPEIAGLPNWVIALVAAGALAAVLSTAAGLLLVISASVSHDLIKKMINPNITEKGELIAARLSAVVAVCVAGYFGINPPDFVAATVALAFGLAAASFFPAIILGIFDKRMN